MVQFYHLHKTRLILSLILLTVVGVSENKWAQHSNKNFADLYDEGVYKY